MLCLFFIVVVMIVESFATNNVSTGLLHHAEKRLGITHAAKGKNLLPFQFS